MAARSVLTAQSLHVEHGRAVLPGAAWGDAVRRGPPETAIFRGIPLEAGVWKLRAHGRGEAGEGRSAQGGGSAAVDVYPEDLDGKPDWPALIAAGPPWHGAIIKVSEGIGGTANWQVALESRFRTQWPAIRKAAGERYGVDFFRGGYHFLRVGIDGAAQANHYLDRIAAAGGWGDGDLWPIVDVENGSGNDLYGKQQAIDCTTAFAQTIRARTGRGVVLYGGSWLADLGIRDKMQCSWLWRPRYTATLPPESYEGIGWTRDDLLAWQYAGDGVGELDGYPLRSPIGRTDVSALIIAGGGTKALDWLRANLRGTMTDAKRALQVSDPRMSGEDVLELQHRLAALGYQTGAADGVYGPVTASAVRAFQHNHALKADGIVGPQTRAALAAIPRS